jgi:antitoxin CcdA
MRLEAPMGKIELRIEVDESVVEQARAAGLDPASVAAIALEAAVKDQRDGDMACAWAEENAEAIAAHKERIEKYGVFGDDLRTW